MPGPRDQASMEPPQTCGAGLAEHSTLPAKLAELTGAVAAILEHHMKALDLTDARSKRELEAYRRLANEHRDVAAQLHAIATEMAGYRDLPMGRHDAKEMAAPAGADAFEELVKREQELLALLENRLEQHRSMLAGLRAVAHPPR